MAERSNVLLSEFTSNLSVSNKRRYLEKVRGVGDPYLIPTNELQIDVLPPVQCTDIFNYLVLGKFLHFAAV